MHERTLTRPKNVCCAGFWSLAKNPFNDRDWWKHADRDRLI